MKTILIVVISLVSLVGIAQVVIKRSTDKTEAHAYTVLKAYDKFEVRSYEAALFSYVVMPSNTYKNNSSQGFRKLAGYIFGGNEKEQSIAMTTPVTMTMGDSMTMKFKIPDGMTLDDMPKPSDSTVRFEEQPAKTVAAIRFSGWANDKVIAKKTSELKELLDSNNIAYSGPFSFLGYNPPYEVTNRRNEVVVEVEWSANQNK